MVPIVDRYAKWVRDNPRLATDLEKGMRGVTLLANGSVTQYHAFNTPSLIVSKLLKFCSVFEAEEAFLGSHGDIKHRMQTSHLHQ